METDKKNLLIDELLLFNALMENTADSIYFKDVHCRMLRVSRKLASDFGFDDPAELIGKTDLELFGEEFGQKTMIDDLYIMETGKPMIGMVESRNLPSGELNWTSTTKYPMRDRKGEIIGIVGITREINELKRAELNLQYLATHDFLTDLPNRFLMLDRMEQCISRANRHQLSFAVLYVDLDGFKDVNDQYGHDIGDQLLRMVALRMKKAVRESDTVARMSGDEFVIILDTVDDQEEALAIAHKVRLVLDRPFDLAGQPPHVTASIGIGLFPQHGRDPATLLKAADHAMYMAKKQKDACAVFNIPKQLD
jgi:diguanylate cyclase (GGDEF)-like protein/PAS domain S-box-containing protein